MLEDATTKESDMALANLSEFYAELFKSLAGGQLTYDHVAGEYRDIENDDEEYVLVGEFLDNSDYVSSVDVVAEYAVLDKKLFIMEFKVYLQDVFDHEGECEMILWSDGATLRTEGDTDFTYLDEDTAVQLFEAIDEIVAEAELA